jgi:hypothetical protein
MSATKDHRITKKHPAKDGEFLFCVRTVSLRGSDTKDKAISKATAKCVTKLMCGLLKIRDRASADVSATGGRLDGIVVSTTYTATGKGKSSRVIMTVAITAKLELFFD